MNESILQQLKTYLEKAAQGPASKQDFTEFIQKVGEFVAQLIEWHKNTIDEIHTQYGGSIGEMKKLHESNFSELRGQVNDVFVGDRMAQMAADHDREMKLIEESMATMKQKMASMKDGHTPMKGKDYFDGKPGADGRKASPEEIASKLNSRTEIVDMSVIKGLKEALKLMNKKMGTRSYTGGGGIGGRGHIKSYDLSDSLNGVLRTFEVPAHLSIISVHSGGSTPTTFRPITDYTYNGTQLEFTNQINETTTLAAGQSVIVVYEEA